MRHTEGHALTADNVNLYTQTWLPDDTPKGMLAFSHGHGEHTGRYGHVGIALTDAGFGLHMADLRGHGKSSGKRGHIMNWDDYQHDFAAMRHGAHEAAPDAAQFMGGHSLGGLIALSVAVSNPPETAGVIASAPFLRLGFAPPGWKITLGKVLSNLTPTLTMPTGLDVNGLSRDQAVVAEYEADPLVHDQISTRGFTETMTAQARTLDRASQFILPLLIYHGTADSLVDVSGSKDFYEAAGSDDKTLKLYEGWYHEPHNEPEKEQLLNDMIAWLDARV